MTKRVLSKCLYLDFDFGWDFGWESSWDTFVAAVNDADKKLKADNAISARLNRDIYEDGVDIYAVYDRYETDAELAERKKREAEKNALTKKKEREAAKKKEEAEVAQTIKLAKKHFGIDLSKEKK